VSCKHCANRFHRESISQTGFNAKGYEWIICYWINFHDDDVATYGQVSLGIGYLEALVASRKDKCAESELCTRLFMFYR
jgi:hypothetical protein